MKIGYTCKTVHQEKLTGYCDDVILVDIKKQTVNTFLGFVEEHLQDDIYIMNHLDLGLQLIQLLPGLEVLDSNSRYIRFMEKEFEGNISDQMYQKLLLHLARNEKNIMSNRMKLEYETAKLLGMKKAGRPSVNNRKIMKIREMYHNEKKTLREVAEDCDVSIGTVYKYAIQLQERHDTSL